MGRYDESPHSKREVENFIKPEIVHGLDKAMHEIDNEYGGIHFTALDAKAYKRHTVGIIKILVRAITRPKLFP